MLAACYIRVSRSDQNPDLQRDEIRAFIERRGWQLVETYEDAGASGSKDRRPALDRLMVDAKRRRFDTLVVWRSDRLFRSLKHMITALDEFGAWGVNFVSVTEPFDTTTPQGRLLLHVASAFAEFERGLLIERTRAGLAAARRRGTHLGRPRVFVPVEQARSMLRDGRSKRDVARRLGIGFGTLHRALASADPEPPMEVAAEEPTESLASASPSL